MSNENPPDPTAILQMISAFQASAAIKAALELQLFTHLGRDARTATALAKGVGASEKGIRILCDFLVIHGLIEKQSDTYQATTDAATFLDANSPAYLGAVGTFLLGSQINQSFENLTEAVRRGGTMLDGQGTVEPDNPLWVDFARHMVPLMQPSADFIGEHVTRGLDAGRSIKVLDVAAGHGIFGIGIATRHANTEVVALDWPAVLEVATENAQVAGVADRHTLLPGDAFEVEFGSGYDIVLLTNFLHHYDEATCVALLKKAHACLNDDGQVVTLEFVPDEDRVNPPDQAKFAMVMLATTLAGDAYTFKQLQKMASDAGFARSEMYRLETAPQTVILSTK